MISAAAVIESFDVASARGVLTEGKALFDKLDKLQGDRDELTMRAAGFEKDYYRCWDEKQTVENEKAELQRQLDAIRASDIRDSIHKGKEEKGDQ